MKRFVTRKAIKVPRYKLLYLYTTIIIILVIVINISINVFLKYYQGEDLVIPIVNNSYGNLFNKTSSNNKTSNNFYKNIYGFPFNNETKVNSNVNLENLISNPLIYIYNTFQTDKYVNPYYSTYSINPVITQASLILQENLKKLNLNAVVETKSVAKTLKENNISYTLSYRGSRILMEEAKKNNSTLKYFLDLGIGNENRNTTTYNSDNEAYAKILFIVGTENPNYLENQKFANSLNTKLESINKDISRGVSLRGGEGYHGVYNQDFSSNALLIYVGGKENTIAEVNRSLKILAQVLRDYIMEENNEKE